MALRLYLLPLFVILLCTASCSSYRKIPYFQNLDRATANAEPIANQAPLLVEAGDILGINVSSLNPEASSVFNYNLGRVNGNNYDNSPGNPVIGYLVDAKGEVQLPLVGAMQVAGLPTAAIGDHLKQRLVSYLREPVVNIRLLNFKISVLGDVLKPDTYTVQNERINVLQALSLAGDLTITAQRTSLLLIREAAGQRRYIPLDLTSKALFTSPYYYLKNNDVLYVQPDKTKFATVDRGYRNVSLVLSGLSIFAIVFSTLRR